MSQRTGLLIITVSMEQYLRNTLPELDYDITFHQTYSLLILRILREGMVELAAHRPSAHWALLPTRLAANVTFLLIALTTLIMTTHIIIFSYWKYLYFISGYSCCLCLKLLKEKYRTHMSIFTISIVAKKL
jgi:hypothetical protein